MRLPAAAAGVTSTGLVLVASGHRWLALLVAATAVFLWRARLWTSGRMDRLFSPELRRALLERDGHRCAYCRRRVHYLSDCPAAGCDTCFEADHVTAWADGGGTTVDNGVTACRRCNQWKRARSVEEFHADPDGDGVPGI